MRAVCAVGVGHRVDVIVMGRHPFHHALALHVVHKQMARAGAADDFVATRRELGTPHAVLAARAVHFQRLVNLILACIKRANGDAAPGQQHTATLTHRTRTLNVAQVHHLRDGAVDHELLVRGHVRAGYGPADVLAVDRLQQ